MPLLSAYARIRELAGARRDSAPLILPNGRQVLIEDFPRHAIREALANAGHSPTILSIASPGPARNCR
jgi:predicted HTH transcriptional regulator